MGLYRLTSLFFTVLISAATLARFTISSADAAAPRSRPQEEGAMRGQSQPAFTNYPQFPISPYFGSLQNFALLRDKGDSRHEDPQLQTSPPRNRGAKTGENTDEKSVNESKFKPLVFNSENRPGTGSLPVQNDGVDTNPDTDDDIINNDHIIHNDANGTSANDIWANVPLANINGFIMPIVPPVILKPTPSPGTVQPGAEVSGRKASASRVPWRAHSGGQHARLQQSAKNSFRSLSSGRMARSIPSDADSLPVMCGEFDLVPGSSLHLASPYYPAIYPDNFSCRWSIKAVAGEKVAVKCRSFVLATGDYLAVGVEGDPKSLVRYTAAQALSFTVLPSNEVFVSFFSDGSQQGKGFSCTAYSMGVEDEVNSQQSSPASAPSPAPQPAPVIEDVLQPSGLSHPQCGLVNRPFGRIVKGQAADRNEYPWQVYLRIRWAAGGVSGCGGSLIAPRWVLTAAHCVMQAKTSGTASASPAPPPKVTALVGAHEITNVAASVTLTIESSRVIVHPKNSFSFDLALIELSEAVAYGPRIRPVCLPTPSMQERNLTGVPMAVIGWGNTETGAQPEALRELGQQGLEWGSCKRVYGDYITEHHFCTTSTKGGHICLGDSGGPTMVAEGGRYYIRGVISFVATKECNLDFPDGHTSVTHFLTWIKEVTGLTV